YLGRIIEAFKGGAAEGYGPEPFGMSEANKKWLNDHTNGIANSFVNAVMVPAAEYLDSLARTPNSIYHAFGNAAVAAGIPRDIVGMPEAFMGSPHPMGVPAVARPAGAIRGAEAAEDHPASPPGATGSPLATRDPLTPHPETQ